MIISPIAKFAAGMLGMVLVGSGAYGAASLVAADHPGSNTVVGVTQPLGVTPSKVVRLGPVSPDKPTTDSDRAERDGNDSAVDRHADHPDHDQADDLSTDQAVDAPAPNELTRRPTATLTRGDSGPLVAELESSLSAIGYWLGTPDDSFDDRTRQAVVAFQKVEGLDRTGIADPPTLTALLTASRPLPRVTNEVVNDRAKPDRLDVELERQVLFVVRDNQVALIFDVSTGAPSTRTPPGTFTVYRDVDGVDRGPLGSLYRPKYFNIGIAFHGYPNVPPTPASHGCIRVSNAAMDLLWFLGVADVGNQVIVY